MTTPADRDRAAIERLISDSHEPQPLEGSAPSPTAIASDAHTRLARDVVALREEVATLRAELGELRREVRDIRHAPPLTADSDGGASRGLPPPPVPTEQEAPQEERRPERLGPASLREQARQRCCRVVQLTAEGIDRIHSVKIVSRPSPEPEAIGLRWEIGMVVALVALAAFLRFQNLSSLPQGLHGDEAIAGLLGHQMAREGWIGPYTNLMSGSPTGFYHAVGLAMVLFSDEVLAIRFVSAFVGVLAVVALYLLMRRSFGIPAALAGAAFLATMSWHVHFSRVGFPPGSWLPPVLLALLALVEASRAGNWRWWAAAGALLGLALYTYNSHVLLLGIVGAAILFRLFGWPALAAPAAVVLYALRPGFLTLLPLAGALVWVLADERVRDRRRLIQALAFGGAFLLGGFGMIRYIADDRNDYLAYGRRLSIFNTEEWRARQGAVDQIAFLADRYRDYWDRVCCHPQIDGVDATGVTPLIPLSMLLLAVVGVVFALRWRGQLAASLGAAIVLIMPLASAFSVDFAMRRSLVVTVFVAMFAGLGVVEALRLARTRPTRQRYGITAALVLVTAVALGRNLVNYFETFADAPAQRWVFAQEITDASHFMDALPPGSYVYFYSARWSFNYETRQFLAPDVSGEDRSHTFGEFSLVINPSLGDPVFVLIGEYHRELPELQRLYPDGAIVWGGSENDPTFIAYLPAAVGRSMGEFEAGG